MDRTAEFKAAVNSLLNRGQIQSSRQHHYTNANSPARKVVKRKALFDDRPVEISELTYVIKQDLSRLNAQTMALQQHVRSTAAKANRFTRQMDEHSTSLVIILQSRLANISMGFKEALEIRTESMQASKARQDQLLQSGGQPNNTQAQQQQQQQQQQGQSLQLPQTGILSSLRNTTRSPIGLVPTSASPPQPPNQYNNYGNNNIPQNGRMSPFMQPPPSRSPSSLSQHQHQQQYLNGSTEVEPYSSSSVHRRKGRVDDYHGQQQYEDDSESAGPASMLFQQQQHAPHVEQHIQNRSSAIEAVESTLQELGGIFQQLAQMVAEQRDTIQRIEANADDIELNINEAQNQLLRYYRNISSDRWLMIKIFLTIIFVFLVVSLVS
ncbi:cis-Golgi t-SNARE syntaxin [Entomortierella chlamydospora]|uniref:Cis-Golgi t-SNARE syntaxin n=1 Tax=Entomortierella chlamydospora TaxID=101097 RepID=A0A9P6N0J4_9FUNG|nr:cis-Golgi t-SNARE syntaxin [Entomortierella chlamydospora]